LTEILPIFARILGICDTQVPADSDSWEYRDRELQLRLDKIPELSAKGGAIRLDGKGLPFGILIIYGNDDKFHALINRCTHFEQKLDISKGRKRLKCCNFGRSTWDYDGRSISGIADDNLPVLEIRNSADNLIVLVPER